MAARGALWNPSIFSPEGKVSYEIMEKEYIRKVNTLTYTQSITHILPFTIYLEMNDNYMNRRFVNTEILLFFQFCDVSNLDE
jgi:hypothetical protein